MKSVKSRGTDDRRRAEDESQIESVTGLPLRLKKLFDEAVSRPLPSKKERHDLFFRMFTEDSRRPRAPGAEKIGLIRMKTRSYMRNSKGVFLENTSLLRQVQPMYPLALSRLLDIDGFYCDADASSQSIMDQPSLLQMVIDCKAGLFDVLLVESVDRIGREDWTSSVFSILAKLNVPVIETETGKPLDDLTLAVKAITAKSEARKIGRRVSGGATIKSRDRDVITKALAYGHTRLFPKSPVIIHPKQGPVVIEAHRLMDEGWTQAATVALFNEKLLAGDAAYKPPGRAKKWAVRHLYAKGGGILSNPQAVGRFLHNRTRNWTEPSSTKMQERRDPTEWYEVADPSLRLVDQAVFDRNQEKFKERARIYAARKKRKHEKGTAAAVPAASQGSGRPRYLLSSIVTCGSCLDCKYHYGSDGSGGVRFLCQGVRESNCHNSFRVDPEKLGSLAIDLVEELVTSKGAIVERGKAYARTTAALTGSLAKQKGALKAEIEKNRRLLLETLRGRRHAEGVALDVYRKEEDECNAEITRLSKLLAAAESECVPADPVHAEHLSGFRSLLNRLRQKAIFSSADAGDMRIVQTWRYMVAIEIIPNDHDYGAAALMTVDLGCFFRKAHPALPPIDFKFKFRIAMSPRQKGCRTPPKKDVDLKMLADCGKCRLTDQQWKKVEKLLSPFWRGVNTWPKRKDAYEETFRSLRAGAGPSTIHSPHPSQTSMINSHLRQRALWAPLLEMLKGFGFGWIDDIRPAMLRYILGEGGLPDAPWTIERLKSAGVQPDVGEILEQLGASDRASGNSSVAARKKRGPRANVARTKSSGSAAPSASRFVKRKSSIRETRGGRRASRER